jgi:hypothetical protein
MLWRDVVLGPFSLSKPLLENTRRLGSWDRTARRWYKFCDVLWTKTRLDLQVSSPTVTIAEKETLAFPLGFWTQGLMLSTQVLLPLEPFHQPTFCLLITEQATSGKQRWAPLTPFFQGMPKVGFGKEGEGENKFRGKLLNALNLSFN